MQMVPARVIGPSVFEARSIRSLTTRCHVIDQRPDMRHSIVSLTPCYPGFGTHSFSRKTQCRRRNCVKVTASLFGITSSTANDQGETLETVQSPRQKCATLCVPTTIPLTLDTCQCELSCCVAVSAVAGIASQLSLLGLQLPSGVDPWNPSVDSQSIATSVFSISLFPYLGFLYHLTKSNTAPRLTLVGFYFLLAFVGATSE